MQEKLQDNQLLISTTSKPTEYKSFPTYQKIAFLLTFLLYCFSHAARTVWGYVKPTMLLENPYYTSSKLGYIDTIFMSSYAVGQYFNGWLGDRVNLKIFLFVGTLFATTGLSLFGYLQGFYHMNSLALAAILFVLNGLGQSTVMFF